MTIAKTTLAALCLLLMLAAAPAQAGKMLFGTGETINKIQDLKSKSPNGEALFLGYKLSRFSIVAPLYMTDDGYVIGIAGTDRFIPLDAAMIAEFQKSGELPTPLARYDIPWFEYAFGYLFWLLIPIIGLWIFLENLWTRRKAAKLAAAEPAATGPLHLDSPPPSDPADAPASKAAHDIGQIRPGRPGGL